MLGSIALFYLGYRYLTSETDKSVFMDDMEKVNDKEGYKRYQGKSCIIVGTLLLLLSISNYLFDINGYGVTYLVILMLPIILLVNNTQTKKYLK